MMTIQQFQTWFDALFMPFLERKIEGFLRESKHEEVKKVLSYLPTYVQKGKRLRPYMAYIGYCTEGGEKDVFPLYAAIEFLHVFCLVQDDIIDNESMRHGTHTVHKKVASLYQSREIGRSVAMLVGDLLLAWAFESLVEVGVAEPYTIDNVMREFRELLSDVLHGQLLDVLLITEENPDKDIIEKSMYLKSAQYSFFRPLYIGMLLAGADEEARKFAYDYGVSIGMGFQLQDDIADCLSDIREGQPTLISWYMFNTSDRHERELFELYFSKEWSEEEEHKLMTVLEESGALSFVTETMEGYFIKAEDAIFDHDRNAEEAWQELINTLMEA